MKIWMVVLATAISTNTHAMSVIAECGGSAGKAYFLVGGGVPDKESGWQKDRISEGKVLFVRNDQGGAGIVFKDSFGEMTSPGNNNAKTVVLQETETKLVILVVYPGGAVESYYLNRPNKKLVWTQLKYAGLVDKGAVFQSDCN